MCTKSPSSFNKERGLNRDGRKRLLQVFITILVYGVILFTAAGRLDWWLAWIFLGLYLVLTIINAVMLLRRDIDLINERGRMAENQKDWDKVLMSIYLVLCIAVMLVAGLDAGRYGWQPISRTWIWLGMAGMILSYAVISSVMMNNAYLSTVARIQDDRGQLVVSAGPYRFVRHPMYTSLIIMWPCTALMLGSGWALLPAALIGVLFVVRTALEDRMLQEELPGYTEYTKHTRFRLVPGLW